MKPFYIIFIFLLSCTKLRMQPVYENTILLSFYGYDMKCDWWNEGQRITLLPAGLTTEQISQVITQVKNNFKPFRVNITIDEALYNAAPMKHRMRVVFTKSYLWHSNFSIGTAWEGCYNWDEEVPCFVFTSQLNYNTYNCAQAGSHEVGHTLGFKHQLDSCNGGLAPGKIMGNCYGPGVTWSNGIDQACNYVDCYNTVGGVFGWR